ncbi:hypothetical protein H5410_004066 [Solanum commersonii]|uniref:Uncharacterized protein n=1 Tax=Solanum commersonii TaxID=4109 RepID=A0A9J6B6C4_SOLCO|nr:hypothetical protein H5410_004066 [Solanum commersonii]
MSTTVREVEDPSKTISKALFYGPHLVVSANVFSLLFGRRIVPFHCGLWSDGYFSDIAKIIGVVWLRLWVQGASTVSNIRIFLAEMSGDSYQLLGIAEQGILPE